MVTTRSVSCYDCFQKLQQKLQKLGNILQKNCQEINTKNNFMTFEILPLNHKFPTAPIFLIAFINFTTDVCT